MPSRGRDEDANRTLGCRARSLRRPQAALQPREEIEAVFDMKCGGTGFIGITTKRLIVYDRSYLRKLKAVVSIPYSRINAIATDDESGLFMGRGFFASSKLVITTGHGDYEFEFRGADKAHVAHDLILAHVLRRTSERTITRPSRR